MFNKTLGVSVSGVTGERNTVQTFFLIKANMELGNDENITSQRNVGGNVKVKIQEVIPEDMIEYYTTNFSSSDANHYYDEETIKRGQSMPVRWPERRRGYSHNKPAKPGSIHYQNAAGRAPYESYHSTLVPIVIKKTPLYLPGLSSYYRKMNIQRRTEKPRIITHRLKEILFGNRDF